MRKPPFWLGLETIAHTIAYDGQLMRTPCRAGRWSAITVPVLVVHGNVTEPWLVTGALPTVSPREGGGRAALRHLRGARRHPS
jgi:hypothetical protein